jgi:hypothetical protein
MEIEKLYSNVLSEEPFIPTDWSCLLDWMTGGYEIVITINDLKMVSRNIEDCVPMLTEWYVEDNVGNYDIESDMKKWNCVDNRTWYEKDMDMGPDPIMRWNTNYGEFSAEQKRIDMEAVKLVLEKSGGNLENIRVSTKRNSW